MSLSNGAISELLARRADETDDYRRRAYQRAARAALMWPEEVSTLVEEGRSLTDLYGLGPRLAARVGEWLGDPPPVPESAPEREDFLTVAEARSVLDSAPGWRPPRGDLQMHTVHSDGKASIREMAETAADLGYEYVAITDHSKGLRVPRGLDERGFAAQAQEIQRVNDELLAEGRRLRVMRSMEMNLGLEGEGDMDESVFEGFDLVLGSFHTLLRSPDDQTDRYLAALRNPRVHVIGHPRGRKFNTRTGLKADWERILQAAASSGKALEINSHPDRQDLNVRLLEEAGGDHLFSIGTDAHSPTELGFIELALAAAIKAGIAKERIINFWSADQIVEWAGGVG